MRQLSLLLCLFATTAHAQSCSFAAVETRFAQLLTDANLGGGAVLVADRHGVLEQHFFGSYSATTVVPIASASKMLSGIRLLQLKDRGLLNLDAPLSGYLPQFTGLKGSMTLRQMFSHTSGYGGDSGDPILFNHAITLAQSVDTIAADYPLLNGWVPGGQFAYGGVAMQVGGRVSEVLGNGDWQTQWKSDIGTPLGITTIDWQGLGATTNYGIAGSAQSNLRDYGRVLEMLANRGVGNGHRILSEARIDEMMVDNVANLPIASAPPGATDPVRYGFGGWLELPGNGDAPLMHSLGAFGYYPWVDFQRNVFGMFMLRGAAGINATTIPAFSDMLATIRAAIDGGGCQPTEVFDRVFLDGFAPL
ncbi:MAG: serine hydrolase domain-containing protein [Tahibacter sp.]